MPALGYQRSSHVTWVRSVLPPKTDKQQTWRQVRIVPGSDICTAANSTTNLVADNEQGRRHVEAEHPGGLGVDDQLELRRLHDRQVKRPEHCSTQTAFDA
jgi:hypothetical protein